MKYRSIAVAALACSLATACTSPSTSPPPSAFSNAVRTDSGISATGAAGTSGGAAAAPVGGGSLITTTKP